jgi:hypothetical protein
MLSTQLRALCARSELHPGSYLPRVYLSWECWGAERKYSYLCKVVKFGSIGINRHFVFSVEVLSGENMFLIYFWGFLFTEDSPDSPLEVRCCTEDVIVILIG